MKTRDAITRASHRAEHTPFIFPRFGKSCAMQYVGSTINKFRIRFNNHKSRLNSHVKLTAENRVKDDIIYKHFNQPDHRGLKDVRIQLVDKVSNERSLREREAQWAYRLRTIYPSGLNSDDFFCSRNPRRDLF